MQTLHRTAGKLIDAVTSDAPLRRNSFDVVFGDHVRQCIKLATNIAMTFGQIGPPKQTVLPWDNAARAVGSWMRLFGPLELGIFCRPPASSRMLGARLPARNRARHHGHVLDAELGEHGLSCLDARRTRERGWFELFQPAAWTGSLAWVRRVRFSWAQSLTEGADVALIRATVLEAIFCQP